MQSRQHRLITKGQIGKHPRRKYIERELIAQRMTLKALSEEVGVGVQPLRRFRDIILRPAVMARQSSDIEKVVRESQDYVDEVFTEAMDGARIAKTKEEFGSMSSLLGNATEIVGMLMESRRQIRQKSDIPNGVQGGFIFPVIAIPKLPGVEPEPKLLSPVDVEFTDEK